jgi:hypothetical protein
MKRLLFACAIASIAAGTGALRAQRGDNPFIDHSDTGETIHVLPAPASIRSPRDTQPTDAPAHNGVSVFPASYGSGNLVNHGGHEIPFAGFFAVYWNGDVAGSAGSQGQPNLRTQVQNFVSAFSNRNDYTIITQYSAADLIQPVLAWAGDLVDGQPTQSSISDSKVRAYLAGLFDGGRVVADAQTIYGVYFPSGMKISTQGGTSCSAFCGYHGHFSYNGRDIKYAVFPYTNCRACSLSGKAVADILTIVTSHEIREAVTDPDLNAWYDAAGYEADDKCAWHHLYQTSTGHFWVQPEYSNALSGAPGPGCVVP